MGKDYHIRNDCRLCNSEMLRGVLALEPTPLANEFLKPGDVQEELFPLHLVECLACGHVQLPVVVDPERLFRNYVYVSGTSPAFVDHFRRYADEVWQAHNLKEGDLVVEIGSNDGTLLQFFKDKGARVLGVDPAAEIAAQASARGIQTLPFFFRETLAESILTNYGEAKLVVANNVFAHADDLSAIVRGVRKLLGRGGAFIFEVQYLGDLLDGGLFDMVYHEHLSYHSLWPLVKFFDRQEMTLQKVQRVPTHGGSIRCTVVPGIHPPDQSMLDVLYPERERSTLASFERLQAQIETRGLQLREYLRRVRLGSATRQVAGYGAPAKATTLMRQFRIGGMIDYVIDDSPWKQGLCMPGTSIPVRAFQHFRIPQSQMEKHEHARGGEVAQYVLSWPDVLVIFAWNFAEPILAKLRASGFFDGWRVAVVPLPDFKEIRS